MSEDGTLLNFGDVFEYLGGEFVYLGESVEADTIFAARILTHDQSKKLASFTEKAELKHSYNPDGLIYSFVVLDTERFKQRIAWFKDTGSRNGTKLAKPFCSLDEGDLQKLKDEILTGPLPQLLKDIVNKTT